MSGQEEALAARERHQGPGHPETLKAMHDLAEVYLAADDHERGLRLKMTAARRAEEALGPAHRMTLILRQNYAVELVSLSGLLNPRYRVKARGILMEILPLFSAAYGPGHRETVACARTLAEALEENGDPREALAVYREWLPRSEAAYGRAHPMTAFIMRRLRLLCLESGPAGEEEADALGRRLELAEMAFREAEGAGFVSLAEEPPPHPLGLEEALARIEREEAPE
jgi:hypothetical protein